MIAIKPSPVQPKYSFSTYDGIQIGGQPYRFFETRETGHIFVGATGSGIPQVMTNSEISRYLAAGNFVCTPNENQPEHLRERTLPNSQLLSLRGTKAQKKAGMRIDALRGLSNRISEQSSSVSAKFWQKGSPKIAVRTSLCRKGSVRKQFSNGTAWSGGSDWPASTTRSRSVETATDG